MCQGFMVSWSFRWCNLKILNYRPPWVSLFHRFRGFIDLVAFIHVGFLVSLVSRFERFRGFIDFVFSKVLRFYAMVYRVC